MFTLLFLIKKGIKWLFIIAIIIVWYFVSKHFYEVAKMKGHDDKKYLWITFFFSIIGILLVISLPTITDASQNTNKSDFP